MSATLESRIAALIDALSDGSRDEERRLALLEELAARQRASVPAYARVADARADADRLAALPTDVFRYLRVAVHPAREDVRVFRTSGTTHGPRGEHFFRDLSVYDRAARAAAAHALFPDAERMSLVMLAPHPDEVPDSSLSYMLGRFEDWFASDVRWVFSGGQLDVDALRAALECASGPLALLGTSFAFVFAEDALGPTRFELPLGSRVMQTGGFKGRSREVAPDALRAAISARYGIPETHVIAEYGMSELSSQMYETTLRDPSHPRRLWVPGWVRASAVDPETLVESPAGQAGILRIEDLANVDSVCVLQTSDLAIVHGFEVELLGRAPGARPRGCSLAVEEALR